MELRLFSDCVEKRFSLTLNLYIPVLACLSIYIELFNQSHASIKLLIINYSKTDVRLKSRSGKSCSSSRIVNAGKEAMINRF